MCDAAFAIHSIMAHPRAVSWIAEMRDVVSTFLVHQQCDQLVRPNLLKCVANSQLPVIKWSQVVLKVVGWVVFELQHDEPRRAVRLDARAADPVYFACATALRAFMRLTTELSVLRELRQEHRKRIAARCLLLCSGYG